MDIPLFHLDFLNNRSLIAIIAILHVVINHALAVGAIPLIALMEWKAHRDADTELDALAYKALRVAFVITTTLGAMTGVGIWFSATLVNPMAIGSLLRVFFWTWFVEWLVFVTEVVLILFYYSTWKTWTGETKAKHVRLGATLALASWITMALIVSILGFMMDPGSWLSDKTLLSGMLNPMYVPQLAFRTGLAMVMAGGFLFLCILAFTRKNEGLRTRTVRIVSTWIAAWIGPCVLGGAWYAHRVPSEMRTNLPVALVTQALTEWALGATYALGGCGALVAIIAAFGALKPAKLPRVALAVPLLAMAIVLGTFERVREFIRKPYAIAGYLYSNGLRVADYPLYRRDGLLQHAVYTGVREVTARNEIDAGRTVFTLACTRCHTTDGVNGVRGLLADLYGERRAWDVNTVDRSIGALHNVRPFMPPFPGNADERHALAAYLVHLQENPEPLEGAQSAGVISAPMEASER